MARKIEDKQTVRVSLSQPELSKILIEPAKDAGLIDFDPTRVFIDQQKDGSFIVVFERMVAG